MHYRNLACVTCLIGVWLGLVQIAEAQKTTARFLLWQPSATSNAMGGVGTALYGDAFAAYYNPAALSFSKSISVVGSFVKPIPFLGNIAHSFFGASYRSTSLGSIAASANIYWKGAQTVTSEEGPEIIGGIDEVDWSGKISYAVSIRKDVSVGVSFSLLQINLADRGAGAESGDGNTTTILFDVGALFRNLVPQTTWRPSGLKVNKAINDLTEAQDRAGFSLGIALLNFGPKIALIDQSQADPPPTTLNLGLAYWPIQAEALSIMIATDFEKQLYELSTLDNIHYGGEAQLLRLICLRVGYFLDTFGSKNSFFTLGGGIRTKYLSINVARYTRAILPSWHFDGTLSVEL